MAKQITIGKIIRRRKRITRLKKFSILMSVISFEAIVFIIIFPLWPKFYHAAIRKNSTVELYKNKYDVIQNFSTSVSAKASHDLIIPKIGVDSEILESSSLDILTQKEGVWRDPESSMPENPGNMVIAGHRFQFLPPNTNTFYDLEELSNGDEIMVYWEGKVYSYKVYETQTVSPDTVSIKSDDNGIEKEITLYTCTPLYTSQNRFVVKAKLVSDT